MTHNRLAIGLALLWMAPSTGWGLPESCYSSRFVVVGTLLMSADRTAPSEPIILQDGEASLGNACAPIRARTKRLRRGMLVRVVWPACVGVAGPIGPV